eukprot:363484-Chlamydomonas_euryale.AAC.6
MSGWVDVRESFSHSTRITEGWGGKQICAVEGGGGGKRGGGEGKIYEGGKGWERERSNRGGVNSCGGGWAARRGVQFCGEGEL